jgi:hypothetical protein
MFLHLADQGLKVVLRQAGSSKSPQKNVDSAELLRDAFAVDAGLLAITSMSGKIK